MYVNIYFQDGKEELLADTDHPTLSEQYIAVELRDREKTYVYPVTSIKYMVITGQVGQ